MARAKPSIIVELKRHLPAGSKVIAAVSGGTDSVVLLHALMQLAEPLGLTIEAAHFDHRLRKGSAADARFVRGLAKQYGIPVRVGRAAVRPARSNIEAWAREQRYRFLGEVRKKRRADYIVTAHHANDVAETLLIKLLANKELTSIERRDERRKVLRPLLSISRSAIDAYRNKFALPCVEDPTNTDVEFLRNRIRHRLIPFLEREFDRRIVETLATRAGALDLDQRLISALIEAPLAAINRESFGTRAWKRVLEEALGGLPETLQWRLAEGALLEKIGYPIGRRHAAAVVSFLLENREGVELPGGLRLRRKGGGIELLSTRHLSD